MPNISLQRKYQCGFVGEGYLFLGTESGEVEVFNTGTLIFVNLYAICNSPLTSISTDYLFFRNG